MPGLDDERAAFRQRLTRGERGLHVVGDIDVGQPVLQHGTNARLRHLHQRHQRTQPRRRFHRTRCRRRRIEGELGGRRVSRKRLDPIEVGDFERAKLFTQHGFERGLPALLDLQLLPEARQLAQFMLGQPRLDLAVGLHVLLQLLERGTAGFQAGNGGGFRLHAVLRGTACLVELRHLCLGVFQRGLRFGQHFFLLSQFGTQRFELHVIRLVEAGGLLRQTFAALLKLQQGLVGIALVRGFELERLFRLQNRGALIVQRGLRVPPLRLHARQFVGFAHDVFGGLRGTLLGHGQLFLGRGKVFLRLIALRMPLLLLRGQRGDLLLDAVARFHHVADLGFQTADFGVGFVERALRGVHRIGRGVMRNAHRFEFSLDMAQLRGLRFQVDLRLFDGTLMALLLSLRFTLAQQPQQVLLLFAVGLQRLEALRDFGLALELFEVGAEFAEDVFHACEVFTRVGEAVFGFAAALFVLRHARGFFQEDAHVIGLGLDDARDHPLPDDGVGTRPEARAKEDVLNVAAAHRLVVDEVRRRTVTAQDALDSDFSVLAPLAGGAAFGVVEHEFDAGPAGRLALRGAVEDDVLHRFATEFCGA